MYLWLGYAARARVLAVRDIFHREWNDVCLSLKGAGVWSTVVMTSVLFNLPYGPWEGQSWWGQLC
eukprot:2897503-Lingulodinium_polyedra.AAC.1